MLKLLCATAALAICVCASAAGGQTLPPASSPAEAYARGCASCHASEQRILRAIPSLDDEKRAAWIRQFMAGHPCERDDLKSQIEQYLLEKSRR